MLCVNRLEKRPCCAVALRRTAWSEHGMASMNQTLPHCVNQMGKTHSKLLAARHGRVTAWARHGNGKVWVVRPLEVYLAALSVLDYTCAASKVNNWTRLCFTCIDIENTQRFADTSARHVLPPPPKKVSFPSKLRNHYIVAKKHFICTLTFNSLKHETCLRGNFHCCTVHYGIYILFIHQQMHFLLNLEKFKFTWKYT